MPYTRRRSYARTPTRFRRSSTGRVGYTRRRATARRPAYRRRAVTVGGRRRPAYRRRR